MRILGFAICLLSLNYSPAFCDMAKFLFVDSENTFVVGQCCATVLPHVFLVKVKVKGTDEYRRTVDDYICRNVYKAICSYKKVCVCMCFSARRHADQLRGPLSLLFNGHQWLFPWEQSKLHMRYKLLKLRMGGALSLPALCAFILCCYNFYLHLLESFRAYYIWKCLCHGSSH